MRMTLKNMTIVNFKGIHTLSIDFNEDVTHIYGRNGIGKSSIADAFTWLLFDKSARGDAPGNDNFRVKPLDAEGNEIHNIDTSVEVSCDIDGKRYELKRVQREKYMRKRGALVESFQGNESTYWINGVDTKLADFKAFIATIADEKVFRLIANIGAFNQIPWQKRREQLVVLSDVDVDGNLLMRDEYSAIANKITEYNVDIDGFRKILTDNRRRINEQLKLMPVRIDEAKKSTPDIDERQIRDAEYLIKESETDIQRVDTLIQEARASQTDDGIQREIAHVQSELLNAKARIQKEHDKVRAELAADVREAQGRLAPITANIRTLETQLLSFKQSLQGATARRDALRTEFMKVRDEQPQVDTVCKYCGQELPYDKVEEVRIKYADDKRKNMERINAEGRKMKAEIETLESTIKAVESQIETQKWIADDADSELAQRKEALANYGDVCDFTLNKEYVELVEKLNSLQAGCVVIDTEQKITELLHRRSELNATIDRQRKILIMRDLKKESEERIAKYEDEQQEYGAQLTETEQLLSLCEKFVQDRCSMLEDSINRHFPNVRWKLFDTQINGALVDCCTCQIPCDGNLIPYECANTAAQINADLEIINSLSAYYNTYVPIIVDNFERINNLEDTDAQLITLSVSTDEVLTIR